MRLGPFTLSIAMAAMALSSSRAQESAPSVVLKPASQPAAGTVSVALRAADAAAISQVLGNALGATVRIDGPISVPVTVELEGVSARAALDAVTAALRGTWRPVYSLWVGGSAAGARRPVPVGRTVTANLSGVSARTALSLVARGAGGSMEIVSELPQDVTLKADAMPVEAALDEIARQVKGSWGVTYAIHPGATPAAAPATPKPTPATTPNAPRQPQLRQSSPAGRSRPQGFAPEGLPAEVQNDPRFFPMPLAPRAEPARPKTTPADPNAAKMLGEGLARVMQMPPAQRRAAVKDFAGQIDEQFRQMQSLPAARRTEQMAAMRPLQQAAIRTFGGLTPEQQREFQPIVAVFNRWMR